MRSTTVAVELDETPRPVETASSDWTDERLVEACCAGDEQAWTVLIKKYQRLIHSFPRRYGANAHDSADVFQLVCAELFVALPRLRKHGSVRHWIMTVAAHQSYHWKRRHLVRLVREGEEIDSAVHLDPSPLQAIERSEREQVVRHAIGQLTEREQELIRLLFYQDPPVRYDEVATRLGLATGSIGMTRARCLEKLQRMLEGPSSKPRATALAPQSPDTDGPRA